MILARTVTHDVRFLITKSCFRCGHCIAVCSSGAVSMDDFDMFCGTMVRLGRELGVPTPFNEFALHAVKALEEKNRGIFE